MDFSKLFGGKSSFSDGSESSNFESKLKGKAIYDFDPSGLERAAKSAHQLKDHPQSAKILEVAITEAQNKRLEILKDQKAYDLKIENSKIEGVKQQHGYAVEILKEEAKTHRTKAEYEDFLARKRQEDRLKLDKASQFEFLKTQEESVRRQEELRKQTIDYEFSKKRANEKELSDIFWKNKSIYKKETKDILMEKYGMKMENEFKKAEMVVSSFGSMIANGFNSFYDNKPKFMAFASGLCILTAGLVFSRRGMALGLKRLESYLFTPKLIKEFKRKNLFFNLGQSHKLLTPAMKFENEGLIYNSKTEKLLHDIIQSTKTSLSNQGVFRNFLLYGPPGTGKTLFAKKLALYSGLSYAILTGGDVVPLREKAVTEIHKVFDWSARNRGLILFLDEADAFLKKRDQVNMGEEMRSALNSFLYRTGGISNNLMLILATNKPEHLDRAVTDRIDMMIEFPLPDAPTRERLFHYYFTLRVESKANQQDFNLNDVIDELVTSSDGFSAREIAKMCLSWETSALSNNSRKITKPLIIDEVKNMRKQNETKRTWNKLEHR